jgi:hypothetical protein
VLDQGGDPAVVAGWIADTQRQRAALVARLGDPLPGAKLTRDEVKALVGALRDIVATLAEADHTDKADLYRELGLSGPAVPWAGLCTAIRPVR